MNKLNLTLKNPEKLVGFLQKFAVIEPSLLLEIDKGRLVAKTFNPQKSVVKYSAIDMDELFEDFDSSIYIKVGIMNIAKLCTAIKFLNEKFTFNIIYEALSGENVANAINLKDDTVEIALPCGSMRLFQYIDDEKMKIIVGSNDSNSQIASFALTKDMQAKINQLTALDSDEKNLKIDFKGSNGVVKACSKSAKIEVGTFDGDNFESAIAKLHFNKIDKEDCIAYIKSGKIVFVSNESDTKIAIGESD